MGGRGHDEEAFSRAFGLKGALACERFSEAGDVDGRAGAKRLVGEELGKGEGKG